MVIGRKTEVGYRMKKIAIRAKVSKTQTSYAEDRNLTTHEKGR